MAGADRPLPVNLATAILVILTSLTLVFLVPALITDLTGDGPAGVADALLLAEQVVVLAAVLVLCVLVRRRRRWAWLSLVGLVLLDAVTSPIRLAAGGAEDLSAGLPIVIGSAAVTLVFVALLTVPRSARSRVARSGSSAWRADPAAGITHAYLRRDRCAR